MWRHNHPQPLPPSRPAPPAAPNKHGRAGPAAAPARPQDGAGRRCCVRGGSKMAPSRPRSALPGSKMAPSASPTWPASRPAAPAPPGGVCPHQRWRWVAPLVSRLPPLAPRRVSRPTWRRPSWSTSPFSASSPMSTSTASRRAPPTAGTGEGACGARDRPGAARPGVVQPLPAGLAGRAGQPGAGLCRAVPRPPALAKPCPVAASRSGHPLRALQPSFGGAAGWNCLLWACGQRLKVEEPRLHAVEEQGLLC